MNIELGECIYLYKFLRNINVYKYIDTTPIRFATPKLSTHCENF